MPDPNRQTVSATQAPALWNASPYLTRWMLWKSFHDDLDVSSPPNSRMEWGLKMQPLLLAKTVEDLKFEVRPNADEHYHRRDHLGCTRDAEIICPDRGPGALETKCVFDYRDWMQLWGGGEIVPRHYEIQNQVQMLVGDPDSGPYKWGVIAAWVAGEMHYFERAPVDDFWSDLRTEVDRFFASLTSDQEPDPFGSPIELPYFATEREGDLDLRNHPDAGDLLSAAKELASLSDIVSAANKTRERCKARLLAAAQSAENVILPDDVRVKFTTRHVAAHQRKASTSLTVKVYTPKGDA